MGARGGRVSISLLVLPKYISNHCAEPPRLLAPFAPRAHGPKSRQRNSMPLQETAQPSLLGSPSNVSSLYSISLDVTCCRLRGGPVRARMRAIAKHGPGRPAGQLSHLVIFSPPTHLPKQTKYFSGPTSGRRPGRSLGQPHPGYLAPLRRKGATEERSPKT